MKILSFKLVNDGLKGVEVVAKNPIHKDNNIIILAMSNIKYPIPITQKLEKQLVRLKKYLLEVTGFWQEEYDQYIKKGEFIDMEEPTTDYYRVVELMRNTRVHGMSRAGKLKIEGVLYNKWKMVIPLKSPGISPQDGYQNYEKLFRGITDTMDMVRDFIISRELNKMEGKQYAMGLYANNPDKFEKMAALDPEELEEMQLQEFEDKGYIIIHMDQMEDIPDEEVKVEDVKVEEEVTEKIAEMEAEQDLIDEDKVIDIDEEDI